jgi:hypothetical protein
MHDPLRRSHNRTRKNKFAYVKNPAGGTITGTL